jgi:hypothetical protein
LFVEQAHRLPFFGWQLKRPSYNFRVSLKSGKSCLKSAGGKVASLRSWRYRQSMNAKIICLLAAVSFAFSGTIFAAGAKTYQITGTVIEATGSKVIVEKGTDRFEFDIDPATVKGSAELQVGSTVTVTYVMSATKIEAATAATGSSPVTTP